MEPTEGREEAGQVWRIKRARAPAIFAESQFGAGLMDVVAKDAGIRSTPSLYDDSLPHGPEADSYITRME